MKKWIILDYKNGNKRIDREEVIRAEERNFILTEGFTSAELDEIKAELGAGFNEWLEKKIDENLSQYIVGIVETENKPTWDDLEYDEQTGTYFLKYEKGGFKMLKKRIIQLYKEECDCGDYVRHNNGGNYHEIHKLHLIEGEDGVYCVIIEETDTRERFPGDKYDVLVFQDGKFRLEDEDWAEDNDIVYIDGHPIYFRQNEAEIIYQNPYSFTEGGYI